MGIKHLELIKDGICNLEAKLDAINHQGETLEFDDQPKSRVKKAAEIAEVTGAVAGTAAYLRGRKMAGPVRKGSRGVLDTVSKGVSGLKGDVMGGAMRSKAAMASASDYAKKKASATSGAVKSGVARAGVKTSSLLKKAGGFVRKATKFSALDVITNLSASVDELTELDVHDIVGKRSKQDKKPHPIRDKGVMVGAGTLAAGAAGAGAVYARGQHATGYNAKGKDAMRIGARGYSNDAHAARAGVKKLGGKMSKSGRGMLGKLGKGIRSLKGLSKG